MTALISANVLQLERAFFLSLLCGTMQPEIPDTTVKSDKISVESV